MQSQSGDPDQMLRGLAHRVDLAIKILLDIESLDDRFNHPISLGDYIEIIFQITGFDESNQIFGQEAGRTRFDGALQTRP